jgi:hypothetical protein
MAGQALNGVSGPSVHGRGEAGMGERRQEGHGWACHSNACLGRLGLDRTGMACSGMSLSSTARQAGHVQEGPVAELEVLAGMSGLGRPRQWFGVAGVGSLGKARQGSSWSCTGWQGRHGRDRRVVERLGLAAARQAWDVRGVVWRGEAMQVGARQAMPGMVGHGRGWQVLAGRGRRGSACPINARAGMAMRWQGRRVRSWLGKSWQVFGRAGVAGGCADGRS